MPSIFVFKITSESKDLESDILNHFGELKLDIKKPLPWEGFTVKDKTNELIYEKDSWSVLTSSSGQSPQPAG